MLIEKFFNILMFYKINYLNKEVILNKILKYAFLINIRKNKLKLTHLNN